MRAQAAAAVVWVLVTALAPGAPPSTETIVMRMKAALEPVRPSVRAMTITVAGEGEEPAEWHAAQARKRLPDGDRMLTVMLAPESVRGIALMVQQSNKGPDVQWMYVPAVRRVRKIVPAARYEAFVGTDFTYADFGFIGRTATSAFLGSEVRDGIRTYRIQEVPRERWYYSRVVTWIAADSWLPLRRELYAPSSELWKVERFADVTVVDGVRTPLRIRMDDVRERGSSELAITGVHYGGDIDDRLFDPARLADAVDSPLWRATGE